MLFHRTQGRIRRGYFLLFMLNMFNSSFLFVLVCLTGMDFIIRDEKIKLGEGCKFPRKR